MSAPSSQRTVTIVIVTLAAAFFGLIFLAIIGVGLYFGLKSIKPSGSIATTQAVSGTSAKGSITDVYSWQLGTERGLESNGTEPSDVSWFTRTFYLPSNDQVSDYLKKEGLVVGRIDPVHYTDDKDITTVTYQVLAQVPSPLLHVPSKSWQPSDDDSQRFTHILVLNSGLPAGQLWDTDNAQPVAEANSKVTFLWKVSLDKNFHAATTDLPPFRQNVFPQEQVNQFRLESSNSLTLLGNDLQQINTQVQNYQTPLLAQVPANPDKPDLLSHKWGGSGSGEPTKSAERIGGGGAAGAAAGAGLGAVAGDAGLGAGAGAGAGLLGGLIYDMVSKSSDRKKHDAAVDDENDSRLSAWRAQVKVLDDQRNQIKAQGSAMKENLLSQLASQITANNGRLDSSIAVGTGTITPQTNNAPIHQQP